MEYSRPVQSSSSIGDSSSTDHIVGLSQNKSHHADAILKCIFLDENLHTLIQISLQLVPKVTTNNKLAMVELMAWHLTGTSLYLNSLRPRQKGRLFADDTFKRIFLNENIRIVTKNSLKFVLKGLINNIPTLVLIMAWRRPGDKPLSEPMLVRSLTHICVTRPPWVKQSWPSLLTHIYITWPQYLYYNLV